MRRHFSLGILCFLLLVFAQVFPAKQAGADAAFFETPEYFASTGLHSLNASQAYALGFSGKGITVAVLDSKFSAARGEFLGKYPYGIFGPNDDDDDDHGIHVSGIIAAHKNDKGMHGVAYDALLMPFTPEYGAQDEEGPPGNLESWRTTLDYPDVRIISNSWGENFFLDTDYSDYYGESFAPSVEEFWEKLAGTDRYQNMIDTAEAIAAAGKLVILASGNEGHLSPSSTAGLPTMVENAGGNSAGFANNWLSVASFDPRYQQNDPRFISVFSNLGQGASEYTVLAPGSAIYSTVGPDRYDVESGTSMATPYTSGVAALVQEAFPYMNGKQLADVLLSTASPMNVPGVYPEFIILERENYAVIEEAAGMDSNLEEGEIIDSSVVVYTYEGSSFTGVLTPEQREYFLEWLGDEEDLDRALANPVIFTDLADYTELFGQGVVDAYKAVQGPGQLNARRLGDGDLSSGEFGGDYAMYGLNTLGFDSIWGNDVGERRADDGALQGLPVGLKKNGGGTLFMTGTNTYQGPTVVEEGGISLGMRGSDGSASLGGDVFVRQAGVFTGDGVVGGNLESSGLLVPGLANELGSRLKVRDSVISSGKTLFVIGEDGRANGLDAKDINLQGEIVVAEYSGALIRPYQDYLNVAAARDSLEVARAADIKVSDFISLVPRKEGNVLSLASVTTALDSLPGVPGKTNAVTGALEHMYHNLKGDPLQRRMDFLYHQSREGLLGTAADLRGDMQAATLTALPFGDGRLIRQLPDAGQLNSGLHGENSEALSTAEGGSGMRVWLRPVIGYAKSGADNSIGQDSMTTHTWGGVTGMEWRNDDLRAGGLLAVGESRLEQGRDEARIVDVRGGFYAGYVPGALSLTGLVSLGWQDYDVDRYVNLQYGREHFSSNYNGYTAGFGLEAAWDLLYDHDINMGLSPYAAFDFDYIRQESRKESGDDVFGLELSDKDLVRTAFRTGLELDFTPLERLGFSASLGYKRLLSGHRPGLDAGFKADPAYHFRAVGKDEGRDFVTYGIGVEVALHDNVRFSGGFSGEQSDRSRSCQGYVGIQVDW